MQGSQAKNDRHDEYEYLLAKYPVKPDDEDLFALYGDSGEEGNFDEETWQEMEKDAAETNNNGHSRRALSLLEVSSTIDEVVRDFKASWQDTKLAKVQAKGFRLWNTAHREDRVQDEIATAQYWIQRLEKSVVKIRQAIARETWPTVEVLRHQCQSLEASIFQQLEHQYNISILTRETAPPRPNRRSIKREKPRPLELANGEILLESESDLSMSNFIDEDDNMLISTAAPPTNTEDPLSLQATEDSDDVISPEAKRRNAKPQAAPVDPRKNPFVVAGSFSSAKSPSIEAESDLDRPSPLPQSRYEKVGHEQGMPIELISSSEPPTPANVDASENSEIYVNDEEDPPSSTPKRLKFTALLHDIEGIKQMAWDDIEKKSDNRRALAKAVYSLSAGKAIQVRNFVEFYAGEKLQHVLQQGFSTILNRSRQVEGINETHWGTTRITTLLFASYCLAKRVVDEPHLDKERTLKAQDQIDSARDSFLKALREIFSNYPQAQQLKKGKRKLSDAGNRGLDSRTSNSDSATAQQTPLKRKKRRMKQSQMATNSQVAGQLRVQEQKQRMASMDQKFQNIPRNMVGPASYPIGLEEPFIYLDPKIGGKVKAHQVNGIRFMWRELMTDQNKQGCLLAHTMGLGKTMQVISVLVTIAQSVKSVNPGIRSQIPSDLRDLKALILCPPSLIDNWYDEILMWRPERTVLGGLWKITQKTRRPDRVQDIAQWASTRGILIISYDMFRGLIVNKGQAGRNTDERPLSDVDHAAVEEHLLDHPSIIIADEAHKMKNTEAGISMVTSRFKSTRRIALTGSPLANNLDEYFAMIDWIAPGYLGTKEQFRSKYATPISEGLWNDSNMADRRTSLRKLHVLKKNLDPKISRADITAIADDIPPKTEFFLTIPLTKLQIKAYNLYITALLGGDETRTSGNARLWDWLAILSLLCNHPSTFLSKLDERQYAKDNKGHAVKAKTVPTTDDVEGAGLPTDIELANAGLSPELVEQERKIFQALEDSDRLEDPSLSHRSQIVCDIIERSVIAGDKVLLFSHSIPTLNYLESTVSSLGYATCRLDGTTHVTKRQGAVKDFNKDSAAYNVFFISTRAGGLGLNLQGANRVILFDYGFNPIWEEQAIGRAYRLGQRKPVFVYRLRAGGTFEELIYNKAVFKTQLAARVVDKKNPMRYASKKITDYLFHVKEVPQEDLDPYYGKDPLVLDQVLRKSHCIRDITLTETFQKEEEESLTPEEVKQANDELKDEQEQRRDPDGYGKRRAEHQTASLSTRTPVSAAARPASYAHNIAHWSSIPGYHQNQHLTVLPIDRPIGYVSRPEAIGGPQQAESGFWDHRAPPLLQNRLQNVLSLPLARNITSTNYPSPTAETRPKETTTAPGSPPLLGKQLDGATDGDHEDSDPDLAECKAQ